MLKCENDYMVRKLYDLHEYEHGVIARYKHEIMSTEMRTAL